MPNWCENKLIVVGPENEVEKFAFSFNNPAHEAIAHATFDWRVWMPLPEGIEASDFWGTRGIDTSIATTPKEFKTSLEEDLLPNVPLKIYQAVFDTAWSPPLPVIKKMIKEFEQLAFALDYKESGAGFEGMLTGAGGVIVADTCWDLASKAEDEILYGELILLLHNHIEEEE